MDLDDVHLYMMEKRSNRSSLKRGRKKSRKRRKEKWPPSITLRKKEDGLLPPLQVGSKMECAGLKVDQRRAPIHQMVVVVTSLSLSHSLDFCPCSTKKKKKKKVFSPRFVTLKEEENLSLLLLLLASFRCFER